MEDGHTQFLKLGCAPVTLNDATMTAVLRLCHVSCTMNRLQPTSNGFNSVT